MSNEVKTKQDEPVVKNRASTGISTMLLQLSLFILSCFLIAGWLTSQQTGCRYLTDLEALYPYVALMCYWLIPVSVVYCLIAVVRK